MTKIAAALILVGFAVLSNAAAPDDSRANAPDKPPFQLTDAAPTPDALVQRLIAALEKKDETAMHAVRVNEREYRELIAPGTVPPGQPPRQTDARISEFYWRVLDTKSRDLGRELLKTYGGMKLTVERIQYTKQPLDYAWYHAVGEVRVHVREPDGKQVVVPAGWVAEVDGRYKFIGLNWND